MNQSALLKQTLASIKNQFQGTPSELSKFRRAFYSHYIFKKLGIKSPFKFPKAQFKYQDVILNTRANTIDFWATLESYEPDLTKFLVQVLDKKGTFVDVGAHIGRFSTLMAKKGWDVISFEPVVTNFNALKGNIEGNNAAQNVQLHNVGLGNETSTQTMFYNKMEMGEASLTRHNPNDEHSEIKIVRFDDYMKGAQFQDFCVMKMDVEGHEESAILGMSEFISAQKPLIILEFWEEKSPNLIAFLKSQGYKRLHIFWYIEEKHHAYIEQMDALYKRANMNVAKM